MAKQEIQRPGYGKLLDYWACPDGAGDPVGCVATTFTFDPVFFEEECLGRFLNIDVDPNDNPDENELLYVIEREEKLSNVMCASALVDQHNCKGQRSLRWDLLSCRLTQKNILHAKISLLHWSNWTRLIIASANLTDTGYRLNQEIFGVLDYNAERQAPMQCLTESIAFLREVASYSGKDQKTSPAINRWNKFLDRVEGSSASWGSTKKQNICRSIVVHPVFTGIGRPSAFHSLRAIWNKFVSSSPITEASVTSPFFDPPGIENRPAKALWDLIKQRGKAKVYFYVTAEEIPGKKGLLVHAPRSLEEAMPSNRGDVTTGFMRIDENQETASGEKQIRPMHLKSIWLENYYCYSYLIGSSNFTSAGLGLSKTPNLEADLVYSVYHTKHRDLSRKLVSSFLNGKELDPDAIEQWQEKLNEDEVKEEDSVLLPPAFGQAIFSRDNKNNVFVTFTFLSKPPGGWTIRKENDAEIIYSEVIWKKSGSPEAVKISWTEEKPPSGFEVIWRGSKGAAWWQVNIHDSLALPPPDTLKDLSLDVLIDILVSARPLHKAIRKWLRRKKKNTEIESHTSIDPHKQVDTSMFLLQRTRRISVALSAIRARLERPVATADALKWRLYGPVGVFALKKAVMKESIPQERSFFLTELALELSRVKPKEQPGCLLAMTIKKEIALVIKELQKDVDLESLGTMVQLKEYVVSTFKEIVG